jgi:hypothetical protein
MLKNFRKKMKLKNVGQKMNLKLGDMKTKVRGNFTAIVWKDKQNVNRPA